MHVDNRIGDESVAVLVKALECNTTLTTLELCGAYPTDVVGPCGVVLLGACRVMVHECMLSECDNRHPGW
jgi:hypothetical protein